MAWIDVTYDFTTVTDDVIAVWYNNAQPTVEIGRKVIDGTVVPKNGSFRADNLQPVVHLFRFYISNNGTTLDQELFYNLVKAGSGGAKVKYFHYVVDGPGLYDPASGQADITDSRLVGIAAADLGVTHRGTTFRHPGTDYVAKTGGGITLLNGETFQTTDKWTIIVPPTDAVAPISVSDYTGVNIINANDTFDDTHKNKKNFVIGNEGETIVLSIGDLQLEANCRACFSTAGMKARYFRLQLANDNYTSFNTGFEDVEEVNQITLRKSEFLEIFIESNILYVVDYKGNIHLVGQPRHGSKKMLNHEWADGSGPHQVIAYKDLIDRIPAEMIVTNETTWNLVQSVTAGDVVKEYQPNKGKFFINTVAGTFHFPLWLGQTFRSLNQTSGTDSTMLSQGAGGMWAQEMLSHGHNVNTTGNQAGVNPGRALQRSSTDGSGGESNDPGSGGNKYIRSTGGQQQRVDSTGFYAQIRI